MEKALFEKGAVLVISIERSQYFGGKNHNDIAIRWFVWMCV